MPEELRAEGGAGRRRAGGARGMKEAAEGVTVLVLGGCWSACRPGYMYQTVCTRLYGPQRVCTGQLA